VQILGLQPRISKVFLTVDKNTFGNKIPFFFLFLDDDNSLATIATINQSPFEWHPLSKQDRRKLACLHSALVSFKPEVIRDACIEFRGDILEDFPAGHSLITC
jgi:hypothetical protein